jgi:1-acyl-sn-glycerol-3-phosphate acyltransferase
MFRTVFFFIVFWVYQLWIIPFLLRAIYLRRKGEGLQARRIAERLSIKWSRMNMAMAGATVTVTGSVDLPPDQSALVASNHMGAFDIPILAGYLGRPIAFIAKVELARVPLIGTWLPILGCILLDRADRRQRHVIIDRAADALKEGINLVIFPEATRSDGPYVRRFKSGATRIAIRAGVPIIPVAMKGTYLLKQKHTWKITPAEVEMIICPSIPTEGLTDNDAGALLERVRATILKVLPDDHDREDVAAFTPGSGAKSA